MAQTKRKRTRKHRGTPAGTIERAGRTGRPQTREDAKQIARQRRAERLDRAEQLVRLIAGIDDQRPIGALAAEDVGVLRHRPDGEHAHVHR